MSLHVEVLGLVQQVSFEDASVVNEIILRFQNGQIVKAFLTEENVKAVLGLLNTEPPVSETMANQDESFVFGGDMDVQSVQPPTPLVDPNAPRPTVVKRPPPVRTVQMDEMGNPVLPGVDHDQVLGGFGTDEDGVGSI